MGRSERKRQVGILGGTFDPVHYGHLILAECMRDELRLDEVRFMPVSLPPHKDRSHITPAAIRCRMLEQALAGSEGFTLSRLELDRGGISYSVETMRALRRAEPGTDFFFLLGADALPELATWKEIGSLIELCRFAVLGRPGFSVDELPSGFIKVEGPAIDISSSRIRAYARRGRSIRYLVPDAVRNIITDEGLYRCVQGREQSPD